MPKYYCDYCDIYLTHDSMRVRRDHTRGWKHGLQVKAYFQERNQDEMNAVIDEILKDYEERGEYVPIYTAPPPPPPSTKARQHQQAQQRAAYEQQQQGQHGNYFGGSGHRPPFVKRQYRPPSRP